MRNNIWFVTGTTTGVGYVLVRRLLDEGYRVAATSRTREKLEELFGPESGQFLPLSITDLSDEGQVLAARDAAVSKFGTVDVVVNNAGMACCGAVEETSDREARELFDVNFFGSLNVIRAFLPVLREQRGGCFLNINSDCGIAAHMDGGLYSASKHAMIGLTKNAATEYGHMGIRTCAVCPGAIDTKMIGYLLKDLDYNVLGPMRRPADPQEIADIVCYLASDKATFLNGAIVRADGGQGL